MIADFVEKSGNFVTYFIFKTVFLLLIDRITGLGYGL